VIDVSHSNSEYHELPAYDDDNGDQDVIDNMVLEDEEPFIGLGKFENKNDFNKAS